MQGMPARDAEPDTLRRGSLVEKNHDKLFLKIIRMRCLAAGLEPEKVGEGARESICCICGVGGESGRVSKLGCWGCRERCLCTGNVCTVLLWV